MGYIWKIDLSWIAGQMGILPCRTFCECAVGPVEISVAKGFIGNCSNLLLIEPNRRLAAIAAKEFNNIVINTAIGFKNEKRMLIENNGSSYLEGTWAPTLKHDAINAQVVETVTFDSVDDGEIDVLALDCEGMEWAVLSRMDSRPELMTIEIWEGNPYREEVEDWLKENDYKLRFSTGPTAETHLYVQ